MCMKSVIFFWLDLGWDFQSGFGMVRIQAEALKEPSYSLKFRDAVAKRRSRGIQDLVMKTEG